MEGRQRLFGLGGVGWQHKRRTKRCTRKKNTGDAAMPRCRGDGDTEHSIICRIYISYVEYSRVLIASSAFGACLGCKILKTHAAMGLHMA